jgi:hypothetical protein
MTVANHNEVIDAIVASLSAAQPRRYVESSLIDPANATSEQLLAGVVSVVSEGGGNFANYRGREGDLGSMDVRLVGFVQVEEDTKPVAVQRAELALLGDLLLWVSAAAVPGLDVMYPGDWAQSKQLEHPFGWVTLALKVNT